MGVRVATSNPEDKTYNTLVVGSLEVVIPMEADMDGDPDTPDSIRLRNEGGGYQSELTAGQPGVEQDGDNPLYFYHFQAVPVGIYAVEVKIDGGWYPVLRGLRVSPKGLFVNGISYQQPADGSVLGTPEWYPAEELPEEPVSGLECEA